MLCYESLSQVSQATPADKMPNADIFLAFPPILHELNIFNQLESPFRSTPDSYVSIFASPSYYAASWSQEPADVFPQYADAMIGIILAAQCAASWGCLVSALVAAACKRQKS